MTAKTLAVAHLLTLLLAVPASAAAPAKLKIYVNTDLEGISGVYKFAQTREPGTPLNREACEYFMGDVAAVVRGLREAGVAEIVVLDGHGSQAVIPHLMVPGAKYITGTPRPGPLTGLDNTFQGMVLLGFHAMMGTPDGVLNHTQSSKSENRYWYNDVESGEIVQSSAIAGHFGVPPIMVTGDEATCREARKFLGEACVTVAVKQGLAREAALLYPFDETRQALYEGAKRAVAAIPACQPYVLKTPIRARKQYLQLGTGADPAKPITKEAELPDGLHILDL